MRICTVQTPNNRNPAECVGFRSRRFRDLLRPALVLIELLIVVGILSMMLAIASLAFTPAITRNEFKRKADDLIRILKMAQNASAESGQRYAVVLDFDEQMYALMPYFTLDKDQILAEQPVLATGRFGDDFQLDYVRFDDAEDTRNWDLEQTTYFRVWLMAGKSGWQNGGKIVLRDRQGNPYTIILNRFNKVITLYPGEIDILEPVNNVLF